MNWKLLEQHARELAHAGPDWGIFMWEALPPGRDATVHHVEGAVAPAFVRGPRVGRPNWRQMDRSTHRELYISMREHDEWAVQWEVKTGKCMACAGAGDELASWSRDGGEVRRPCGRCQGSGAAKAPEEAR